VADFQLKPPACCQVKSTPESFYIFDLTINIMGVIMVTRRQFVTGFAAVPVLSYLSFEPVFAATPTSILVMAIKLDIITSLDPHEGFESVGTEITGNIYQQLVKPKLASPDEIEGDLAVSWTASPDMKTFTFKMDPKAKWADGKPVTAEDAAFSLQRSVKLDKSPAYIINQFGYTKDNVDSFISAPDAHTLVIKTAEPASESFLLYCLSANVGCIVQKSACMAHQVGEDLGNAWLKKNSAGSGAFKLRDWKVSESVILETNKNNPHAGKIQRIILRHIVDPSAQLLMLKKGDIDIARDLNTEQLRPLVDDKNFTLVRKGIAGTMMLSANTAHPNLSKPQVWQAIKWAIDYDSIQQHIVPLTHKVHQSFLPEGFPAAVNTIMYKRDVTKAKALMAEAGFPDGFEITLDHYSSSPQADIVQALQANLAEIGIKVTLLAAESRQVLTKMRARQQQLAFTQWGADYFDPNSNAEAFCSNPDNSDKTKSRTLAWRCNWQDQSISDLSQKALHEPDPATRIKLYEELQIKHMENSPFAIMMQPTLTAACRHEISGVVLTVMSTCPYEKVMKA
jgi:peptide/nickel transport system substrate-binding protein